MKTLSTAVDGVSRLAWTTLTPEPSKNYAVTERPASGNQNKILKNILNALQLKSVDLSISRLDDHSKAVFPFLFFAFSCLYWLYYTISQGASDGVDEF